MAKLRVGIIGGGGIANGAHLPVLSQRLDQIELAGVADIDEAAAQKTAARWNIARTVTNYNDLLPEVDAVYVCVPTHVHAEATIAALNAGKPVFCEKPMARKRAQAEAMRQAAQTSGAPLQLGFVRRSTTNGSRFGTRFRPANWGVRSCGATCSRTPGRGKPCGTTRTNRAAGRFWTGCIHNLDFALFLFGPAEWVFTHGRTLREGSTAIDTGTATIHFVSGDELLLAWSWGLPPETSGGRVFEFLGPQGTLTWPRDTPKGAPESRFVIHTGEARESISFRPTRFRRRSRGRWTSFLAVAQGKTKPRAGADEGIAALDVALAILESGRTQATGSRGVTGTPACEASRAAHIFHARLVLIGCGAHAQTAHADPLRRYAARHPDAVTLVAACDIEQQRAETFCRDFGFARAYTDWRAMLDAEKPDAVVSVVPVAQNAAVGIELLQRRLTCLLEKPPGATPADVAALVRVARETGTPHQISVNRRFSPFLNQAIAWANEASPVRYVHARMLRHARRETNFVWETGVHIVDAVRYIGGEWADFDVRVIGPPQTSAPWYLVSLRFVSGCLGTIEIAPTAGRVEETYELRGEGFCASATTMGGTGEAARFWRNKTLERETVADPDAPICLRDGSWEETCAFLDAVRRGTLPRPTVEEVAPTMALCAQIADAAAAVREPQGARP
jgi:predicted dehydrogenase